jgi:hypothetical protein
MTHDVLHCVAWRAPDVLDAFSQPIAYLLSAPIALCISCLSQDELLVFLW